VHVVPSGEDESSRVERPCGLRGLRRRSMGQCRIDGVHSMCCGDIMPCCIHFVSCVRRLFSGNVLHCGHRVHTLFGRFCLNCRLRQLYTVPTRQVVGSKRAGMHRLCSRVVHGIGWLHGLHRLRSVRHWEVVRRWLCMHQLCCWNVVPGRQYLSGCVCNVCCGAVLHWRH
jgi:hypothetical protein